MIDHKWSSSLAMSSLSSCEGDFSVVGLRVRTAVDVAAVYDEAGDSYTTYADGDSSNLFAFDGIHSYADRHLWALLDSKLEDLRASGARTISFLDAGCGPGTWLRRLVARARELGFTAINARGFDVAQVQVQRARSLAETLSGLPGVNLTFDVADLTDTFPECDASIDITLCLYSVLSHLPAASLTAVSKEIARVTTGHFISTVRPTGSPPTAFVDSIEKVYYLKQDHARNQCEIVLGDGRRIAFSFHLFTAVELRGHFMPHFDIEDLRGLDLFHTRFTSDQRWNPSCTASDTQFPDDLVRLEETHARSPHFVDRAVHLLLVARSRRISSDAATVALPPFFADAR